MKLFAGFLLCASLFSFAGIFTSCNKGVTDSETAMLTQMDTMNIAYGTNVAQKMDVYLPAGRTSENTKVIVFIHGGSWNAGDKSDFDTSIPAIRTQLKDFAIFNINYRLANNGVNLFPAQIQDIQSALAFITTKATDYHINPNKIVLIGASAGAHLALLQAYKNNSDSKIKAVIDLFGPTDLVTLYTNHPFPAASQPVLINLLGATPASNPTLYRDASPINFVTAQSVPTQIFHGGADFVVPIIQSTTLKNKLDSLHVKAEMVVYPTEGHGWFDANLNDTYAKAILFIQQNVQ